MVCGGRRVVVGYGPGPEIFWPAGVPASQHPGIAMQVVAITRENIGKVVRWRIERSGTHSYLHAFMDGEWCQVVVTRSDPACIPPRQLRHRAGEFTWHPGGPGKP